MNKIFECKVSYEKVNEEGNSKKVSELYLVDAVSFTDAETIITEEVSKMISGEFDVETIKKETPSEIFQHEDGGTWFKVKVSFLYIDEISGREKKDNHLMYLQTDEISNVISTLKVKMKDTVMDYVVSGISETKVLDYFTNKND